MVGFRGILIAVVLTGLFLFSLVSFGVQIAIENDAESTLLQHPAINRSYERVSDTLSNLDVDAQSESSIFENETATAGPDSSLSFFTLPKVLKNFASTTRVTFGILTDSMRTLGVNAIIISILAGIFILTLLLLAWRVIKTGE